MIGRAPRPTRPATTEVEASDDRRKARCADARDRARDPERGGSASCISAICSRGGHRGVVARLRERHLESLDPERRALAERGRRRRGQGAPRRQSRERLRRHPEPDRPAHPRCGAHVHDAGQARGARQRRRPLRRQAELHVGRQRDRQRQLVDDVDRHLHAARGRRSVDAAGLHRLRPPLERRGRVHLPRRRPRDHHGRPAGPAGGSRAGDRLRGRARRLGAARRRAGQSDGRDDRRRGARRHAGGAGLRSHLTGRRHRARRHRDHGSRRHLPDHGVGEVRGRAGERGDLAEHAARQRRRIVVRHRGADRPASPTARGARCRRGT